MMNVMEQAVAKMWLGIYKDKTTFVEKSCRTGGSLASRTDVYITIEKLMREASDKANVRVINIVEQAAFVTLKTCNADHISGFIKGALESTLTELLLLVLDNSSEIENVFKNPIVRVETALNSLSIIASAIINVSLKLWHLPLRRLLKFWSKKRKSHWRTQYLLRPLLHYRVFVSHPQR